MFVNFVLFLHFKILGMPVCPDAVPVSLHACLQKLLKLIISYYSSRVMCIVLTRHRVCVLTVAPSSADTYYCDSV